MAELDDILAGGASTPASEATQPEQQQVAPEQSAPEGESPEDGSEQAMVPVAAIQAERAKVKRYTEQVAEFDKRLQEQSALIERLTTALAPKQPEPKAPDFWESPEAAVQGLVSQAVTPVQQAMMQQREQVSLMLANEKHGADKVSEAMNTLRGLQANRAEFEPIYRQIMSSPHPYGALVEWHGKHQLLSEIGSDPAAYKEKLKAEILAEMQKDSGQQQVAQAPAAMPSNFATARNVGNRSGPAWSGPTPLADIFAQK